MTKLAGGIHDKLKHGRVMTKYCFACMNPIENKNHSSFRVREDFCHPSYWNNDNGDQYGELEDGTGFGALYLHRGCGASEAYGNPLGEGYEYCAGCDTVFNGDDLSYDVYEKSGETLCPYCARDFVLEHLEEFANEGLPDFSKPLPGINLAGMSLKHPRLREAPEDTQGWATSLPVPKNDIGYGMYRDAIRSIVERGNRWLVIVGSTSNICALSVTVYEVLDENPTENLQKYCTGFRCWSCAREGRYTVIQGTDGKRSDCPRAGNPGVVHG